MVVPHQVERTLSALNPPLTPRDGLVVQVLGIARISTVHQNEKSLEDQEGLYREWLGRNVVGAYSLKMISSRGSGEVLDRPALLEAYEQVASRKFDLVIAEDLGRISRRATVITFVEDCQDTDTRLIALNDNIDTLHAGWRLHTAFASIRHEAYNEDTSLRIKRTLRHRFMLGGVLRAPIYGYIKPPNAKSDSELAKDPAAEPIVIEIFRRLEAGQSYAEIGDWLNELGIEPGVENRSRRWSKEYVRNFVHNPMLKGTRVRNRKTSRRNNRSGRRSSVDAHPSDLLVRECPHLAFVEPNYYDRVITMVDERNAIHRRRGINGLDHRRTVPRSRTIWPGQHLTCGICGRLMHYGGHGQNDHLVCRGAMEYKCWNGISVNGPLAANKLASAISETIAAWPEYDDTLLQEVTAAIAERQQDIPAERDRIAMAISAAELQLTRISTAIGLGEPMAFLITEGRRLEDHIDGLRKQHIAIERSSQEQDIAIPTLLELRTLAANGLQSLAHDSQEFAHLMRQLIPSIHVLPCRLIDGGMPVLRARLTVSLGSIKPINAVCAPLLRATRQKMIVDLFDPPQREQFRSHVKQLRAVQHDQRKVGRMLGITQPAVQHAIALQRTMDALGLTDPYQPMLEPPADCKKLRRHLHRRYRFEPLESIERDDAA